MDRLIEKKKWTVKRISFIAAIFLFAALLVLMVFGTFGKSRLNVDNERITIAGVSQSNFREFIPVTGIIQPVSTIYLDLQEGGRIEEIFVEDGAVVTHGQPILRLSNTDLELSLTNQETQVYNLLAQVQIAQNGARQNTINKLTQSIDVENQLIEAERIYKMNKQLFASNVVAQQEYAESENYYNYLLKKKELMTEILVQDSIASTQQLQQAEQSYKGAQNGLTLMRGKFADLTVSAPVEGQLTSLDAEIGQSKSKGERIGQIDVLSGFKVRVDVDEHYISRIYAGLEGQYQQGNTTYTLTIKKVYTQVTSGSFAVDMEFNGKTPEAIRRGQTLQIRIALGDEAEALIIPRGGFYQHTGGNWIFKVSDDGKKAYRTPVRIGRQNPDYYEVLEGLQPGDRVIVNSYENYGDIQELIIKN
ncbi:MAG: efflux RND transporter periplasmic adaptor subunit [Bacteroidales bacterium]|jgi:HlyD family secretion protein|nr:efflux RND transporter periplasmic adaptor subunit [Bacteroidales bacterium]